MTDRFNNPLSRIIPNVNTNRKIDSTKDGRDRKDKEYAIHSGHHRRIAKQKAHGRRTICSMPSIYGICRQEKEAGQSYKGTYRKKEQTQSRSTSASTVTLFLSFFIGVF